MELFILHYFFKNEVLLIGQDSDQKFWFKKAFAGFSIKNYLLHQNEVIVYSPP